MDVKYNHKDVMFGAGITIRICSGKALIKLKPSSPAIAGFLNLPVKMDSCVLE